MTTGTQSFGVVLAKRPQKARNAHNWLGRVLTKPKKGGKFQTHVRTAAEQLRRNVENHMERITINDKGRGLVFTLLQDKITLKAWNQLRQTYNLGVSVGVCSGGATLLFLFGVHSKLVFILGSVHEGVVACRGHAPEAKPRPLLHPG